VSRRTVSRYARRTVVSPEDQIDYWKRRALTLEGRVSLLQRRRVSIDLLIEQVKSIAPVTYRPPSNVITYKPSGLGKPHRAVLLLSDMHVGQVVSEDQTLSWGRYNFDVCLRRLSHLERTIQ